MNLSTIAEELQHNPRLHVKSAAEYAVIMDTLNLAPPKMLEQALPITLQRSRSIASSTKLLLECKSMDSLADC